MAKQEAPQAPPTTAARLADLERRASNLAAERARHMDALRRLDDLEQESANRATAALVAGRKVEQDDGEDVAVQRYRLNQQAAALDRAEAALVQEAKSLAGEVYTPLVMAAGNLRTRRDQLTAGPVSALAVAFRSLAEVFGVDVADAMLKKLKALGDLQPTVFQAMERCELAYRALVTGAPLTFGAKGFNGACVEADAYARNLRVNDKGSAADAVHSLIQAQSQAERISDLTRAADALVRIEEIETEMRAKEAAAMAEQEVNR